jgi:hypothetical protein
MHQRRAIGFIAPLVLSFACMAQVPEKSAGSASSSKFSEWADAYWAEHSKEVDGLKRSQRTLRREYELRTAITHISLGLFATAVIAGVALRRNRRYLIPVFIAGTVVTVGSWAWFAEESDAVKYLKCKQSAANKDSDAGTRLALNNCTELYGEP